MNGSNKLEKIPYSVVIIVCRAIFLFQKMSNLSDLKKALLLIVNKKIHKKGSPHYRKYYFGELKKNHPKMLKTF